MICFLWIIIHSMSGFCGADGMAVRDHKLFLCCEGTGTVLSFDSTFSEQVECSGLHSPEGIYVTPEGAILVAEDTPQGRILSIAHGETEVIASGLGCPEGVACDNTGEIWFTTGGFQAGELLTSLWRVRNGIPVRAYSLPSVFSFSDLEIASSGMIYVCSESSGAFGNVSVFSFDPDTGIFVPFAAGIDSCEGICLTDGGFPMYLISEPGAVFSVDSSGTTSLLCEISGTLEDVILFNGELLVSQDSSGSMIRVSE